ncbi:GNAT family N-acetyltransferase [Burkholderia ubonensis]|uniref:GNAT family N-acetyltransferase n=1 Tax=Burkholderia ubonensis TaxID=101571 RepID=UPI0009B363C5|nr:GNAT family N-acetyltransferase [Burkholderia ubonensis]
MQSKPVRPAFFMRRADGDARRDGRVRNVLRRQCGRRNNPCNELLIGLCGRHHEKWDGHPLAPCVEIAWRQARAAWGHGYMNEAASCVLADGFQRIGLADIFAWTTDANLRSQRLMQRIGMQRQPMRDFDHPALAGGHPLRRHVVYVARSRAASR